MSKWMMLPFHEIPGWATHILHLDAGNLEVETVDPAMDVFNVVLQRVQRGNQAFGANQPGYVIKDS